MSDGREEREERAIRIEQEKRENREDRLDRDDADEFEPERVELLSNTVHLDSSSDGAHAATSRVFPHRRVAAGSRMSRASVELRSTVRAEGRTHPTSLG